MLELEPMLAAGKGFTVTVTELEFTHPVELVSVRVYIVVVTGETVGFDEVEEKPAGELDQE
jgi:hypothetical protein